MSCQEEISWRIHGLGRQRFPAGNRAFLCASRASCGCFEIVRANHSKNFYCCWQWTSSSGLPAGSCYFLSIGAVVGSIGAAAARSCTGRTFWFCPENFGSAYCSSFSVCFFWCVLSTSDATAGRRSPGPPLWRSGLCWRRPGTPCFLGVPAEAVTASPARAYSPSSTSCSRTKLSKA